MAKTISQSPIVMGIPTLVSSIFLLAVGVLSVWGAVINDGQGELIAMGDGSALKVAEIAARNKDYALAERMYEEALVLGSEPLEELIWPERKFWNQIEELKEINKKIPSVSLNLRLAVAYFQVKEFEMAKASLESAKEIDPNNREIEIVESLF